jgi:phospholipid/cholesterol/gamma-HCH transport system permease protein
VRQPSRIPTSGPSTTIDASDAGATSPVVLQLFAGIGVSVQEHLGTIGRSARFVAKVARAVADVRSWSAGLATQMLLLGVESMPLAAFIALFTGVVLALLASYTLTGAAVPLYFVGTSAEKAITMELAPVLTGLALAGRVGANIAAELGSMRVTEQIDALETLAYDPYAYLVVPRVLAGTLTFPIIVGLAIIVGIGMACVASLLLLDLPTSEFVKGVRMYFDSFDLRYGVVKGASFGFAVTLASCRSGLNARGGAAGVGQAATNAVVHGAMLVLVLDAFWAVTWLLGRAR